MKSTTGLRFFGLPVDQRGFKVVGLLAGVSDLGFRHRGVVFRCGASGFECSGLWI